MLNRTLALHRLASADPYAGEVRRAAALRVRVGYGSGEDVAEGRWAEAVEVPLPKPPRTTLAPQERLAALLAARDAALACEELALRAEADLAAGRLREGALELRNALSAATTELRAFTALSGMGDRIAELEGLLAEVDLIVADVFGAWPDSAPELLHRALTRLQAALRARLAASGL
jgi:hypothetical protein